MPQMTIESDRREKLSEGLKAVCTPVLGSCVRGLNSRARRLEIGRELDSARYGDRLIVPRSTTHTIGERGRLAARVTEELFK